MVGKSWQLVETVPPQMRESSSWDNLYQERSKGEFLTSPPVSIVVPKGLALYLLYNIGNMV